jgi:multidrug resistance protein MdtO
MAPRERVRLAGLVRACLVALDRGELAVPAAPATQGEMPSSPQALAATEALDELRRELAPGSGRQSAAKEHAARQLFVPDALSNPAHWQFALKTTLAIMIVYSAYTLLDWSGLRTSIVTCFFVALGSLGETVHKLTLRLSGAIIGGLLAGLSIVFLLPYFTDIGQLCALTAVFSLLAGWVATASERLSYAGLQMAFAFFLGVLQTYSPATDLTGLRDRIVGIILGNVVMALVFSTLWPESAIARLRAALADALRGIAALLKSPEAATAHRRQTVEALWKADNFSTLSRFEVRMLPQQPHMLDLGAMERLAGAAFVATNERLIRDIDSGAAASLADWANRAAQAAAAGSALPALAAGATTPESGSAAQAALADLRFAAAKLSMSAQ